MNISIYMPQHRCGKRIHAPTLYNFVIDAQSAPVPAFLWAQEVLFCHQGFKCSPCQVQKGTTCSGQASSLRLTSSSVVQV